MKAHVLATKINSVLRDNKFDRYVSGKTRGKLDFTSLSKIAYSPKVFKKREARLNKDYKVIILADASGSMTYDKRDYACAKSIELVSEALEQTDVKYAVWSFAGDVLSLKDFDSKKPNNIAQLYQKHLRERVLVECYNCLTASGSFEDVTTCPHCSTSSNLRIGSSSDYNVDGLALHLALEEIQKLEGKHIVVILSDGQADATPRPSLHYMTQDGPTYAQFPVKKVVASMQKKDTVLCSIGIQSEAVRAVYPKENTVVIHDVSQLGDALVNLIKKQITRG